MQLFYTYATLLVKSWCKTRRCELSCTRLNVNLSILLSALFDMRMCSMLIQILPSCAGLSPLLAALSLKYVYTPIVNKVVRWLFGELKMPNYSASSSVLTQITCACSAFCWTHATNVCYILSSRIKLIMLFKYNALAIESQMSNVRWITSRVAESAVFLNMLLLCSVATCFIQNIVLHSRVCTALASV